MTVSLAVRRSSSDAKGEPANVAVLFELRKAENKANAKVIEARSDAATDKSDAQYKVEKEKCDALAGAAKDNCLAQVKARFGK